MQEQIPQCKKRKKVHFALLGCIIFIQMFLLIQLYSETVNESKLEDLQNKIKFSSKAKGLSFQVQGEFIAMQRKFRMYAYSKNEVYLKQYYAHLEKLKEHVKGLSDFTKTNKDFYSEVSRKKNYKDFFYGFNSKIDSLNNRQVLLRRDFRGKSENMTPLSYKEILNSIHVESHYEVDSVVKKKFLGRLSDAINGKTAVQKERMNFIMTMKYGDKVSSGDIKDQVSHIFKKNNSYYQNEFEKYKKETERLKKINGIILENYERTLNELGILLNNYTRILNSVEDNTIAEFKKQYAENIDSRSYTNIGLLSLMILVSGALVFFTRLAYIDNERLQTMQRKIEQNLKFKGRIVGMIAHEVRSPLHIISIYLSAISKQIKDVDLRESVNAIQFTTKSLSLLVNQILNFSKNEGKNLVLNKANFNLKKELTQILNGLASLVQDKGNIFKLEMNIFSDLVVSSDAIKIQELFYNIIGNANKFTNKGIIEVFVCCSPATLDSYELKVKIKDNGIGMPPEDLKNVFEAYYQGEVSDKVHNLGLGLGLNLCKEFVELFGGDIHVESELNKGTTISFNLFLQVRDINLDKESKKEILIS